MIGQVLMTLKYMYMYFVSVIYMYIRTYIYIYIVHVYIIYLVSDSRESGVCAEGVSEVDSSTGDEGGSEQHSKLPASLRRSHQWTGGGNCFQGQGGEFEP